MDKIEILKVVRAAPDNVHTRVYEAGEVYELGSTYMPNWLADQLIAEGWAKKGSKLDVMPFDEPVDLTLDVASGAHRVSAMPLETRIREAVQVHAEMHHDDKAAEETAASTLTRPRSALPPARPQRPDLDNEHLMRTVEANTGKTLGAPVVSHASREAAIPDEAKLEEKRQEEAREREAAHKKATAKQEKVKD
jgi:hypothetical protein